ncbi:MAG: endonuclease V [Planctomycetota bacterium]|nr:MAG: endonuclease V [Planctomycetota bacterium]
MKIPTLHTWPRSPRAAIALQERLAERVRLAPVRGEVRLFGGADVAFSPDGLQVIAGVVVWCLRTGELVEQRLATRACRFPYVPGLLSFRELPAVLAALRRLRTRPDVVLCDAQGLAHPRRFGLACHLGLWLGIPTVGCAKSRLCGEATPPAHTQGACTAIHDGDRRVGSLLRTRAGVKPLWVSPGHLCDFESAERLTMKATTRYRLPEPTRLAHRLVTRARQDLKAGASPSGRPRTEMR